MGTVMTFKTLIHLTLGFGIGQASLHNSFSWNPLAKCGKKGIHINKPAKHKTYDK